ncbi:MAG: PGF-pre-PGF domain-containing protein, partial [Candidatus Nanoarchaeia archaeon]|nr:PGF-pre-PGF domain-containing protein [Candidatus Nanoarchaeia archaeon]
ELAYSLVVSPDGMKINSTTGLINWIPKDNQSGKNNVTIQVTDNLFNVTQSFVINVQWVNDPPIIISRPINEAYVSEWYYYHVNATDEENNELNYSLIKSPSNMQITKEGLIKWKPNKNNIGNNEVAVKVMDNESYSIQGFNITVYEKTDEKNVVSSRGSRGGGYFASYSENNEREEKDEKDKEKRVIKTTIIKKESGSIFQINLKSEKEAELIINEMNECPEKVRGIEKKVYRYIEIINEDKGKVQEAEIEFKVEKSWLYENQADKYGVILSRYSGNKWEELETLHYNSDEEYEYYRAKTSGFSYFAVSLKKIVEPNNFDLTGPKEQFIISGIIYQNRMGKRASETEIKITNLATDYIFLTSTGALGEPGAYYIIIDGKKGDEILVEVTSKGIYKNTTIILNGDMKNVDFMLNNKGLSMIIGYSVSDLNAAKTGISFTITVIIIVLMVFYCLFLKNKKDIKSEDNIKNFK